MKADREVRENRRGKVVKSVEPNNSVSTGAPSVLVVVLLKVVVVQLLTIGQLSQH